MSKDNKKGDDVEMKDSTAAADKKEEVKKDEPYDPFFGKRYSILKLFFRVQEDHGSAREGREGQGQQTSELINQIIEEVEEDLRVVRRSADPLALPA